MKTKDKARKKENDCTDYLHFPAVSAKWKRARTPRLLNFICRGVWKQVLSVSVLAQTSGRCNNDWTESERMTATTKGKPSTT